MTSAARAPKTPLFVTWLRNAGPSPPSGPPDVLSAITIATGTRARTASRATMRRRRNRYRVPRAGTMRCEIDLKIPDLQGRCLTVRPATDQCAHPREQHGIRERLRQKVVGPDVERLGEIQI